LAAVGLTPDQLPSLRKTDPRKQAVVWLIRKHTTVRNAWVSEALRMGHEVNVSQSVSRVDRAESPDLARLKAKRNCQEVTVSVSGIGIGCPLTQS
jgi:hypothetical protein